MAAKKYLKQVSGDPTEQAATVVSAGVANDGDIPALDSTGHFDLSLLPTGVGPDIEVVVASEALAAGALVNLWNNSGTLNVRNADASVAAGGKRAHGYVLAAVAGGGSASVYFLGRNTGVSGLTAGLRYFLSNTTPGGYLSTAPSTSGHCIQSVGVSISATDINIEINPNVIILA